MLITSCFLTLPQWLQSQSEVSGIYGVSQCYSLGGNSDAAVRCQYCSSLLIALDMNHVGEVCCYACHTFRGLCLSVCMTPGSPMRPARRHAVWRFFPILLTFSFHVNRAAVAWVRCILLLLMCIHDAAFGGNKYM